MMKTWKYYKHAMIPTTAPHEEVETQEIYKKQFWRENRSALLARWTTDWDCGYATNWWYVIKDTPFEVSSLKSKRRYEINKGKKNFSVRRIDATKYADEIFDVTVAAYSSWPEKYRPNPDKETFLKSLNSWSELMVYGAFSVEDKKLYGYAYLKEHDTYYDFVSLRVAPEAERAGINAAIVAEILEDYNQNGQFSKYICDGARSISHETNFQDYLEKYFGFRKAYCKLHIAYNPRIKLAVKVLFPFRKILHKFDEIDFIHQINSVLYMEELCRS